MGLPALDVSIPKARDGIGGEGAGRACAGLSSACHI